MIFLELYDQLVKRLLEQGQRSYDEDDGYCRYRGPNGFQCFAGPLAPDLEEGQSVGRASNWPKVIEAHPEAEPFRHILIRGQQIHDDFPVEDWPELYAELRDAI